MDKFFGSRLREARNSIGMYQKEAAHKMNMSRPTLSAIESGKRAVTAEEIKKFSSLYQVTTNWLLFGDNQIDINQMKFIDTYYRLFTKLNGHEQKEIIEIMKNIIHSK